MARGPGGVPVVVFLTISPLSLSFLSFGFFSFAAVNCLLENLTIRRYLPYYTRFTLYTREHVILLNASLNSPIKPRLTSSSPPIQRTITLLPYNKTTIYIPTHRHTEGTSQKKKKKSCSFKFIRPTEYIPSTASQPPPRINYFIR